MTTDQAKKCAKQLQVALNVYLQNLPNPNREGPVEAELNQVSYTKGSIDILFELHSTSPYHVGDSNLNFDTVELAQTVEKLFPNNRICNILVNLQDRHITFVCKELGKPGTIHIKIH